MNPIDCLGFDHIDLTVNDLTRSTEYYDRVLSRLGFEIFKEESASQSVIFLNGITSIGIADGPQPSQGSLCAPSLPCTGHGPGCKMGLSNSYPLDDQTSAVYIATVPEPTPGLQLAAACLTLAVLARRHAKNRATGLPLGI